MIKASHFLWFQVHDDVDMRLVITVIMATAATTGSCGPFPFDIIVLMGRQSRMINRPISQERLLDIRSHKKPKIWSKTNSSSNDDSRDK